VIGWSVEDRPVSSRPPFGNSRWTRRAIKGMHKQLRERDRQIAALRSQLEA
jgi:hypothetical protein